jgi:hypothetical protein
MGDLRTLVPDDRLDEPLESRGYHLARRVVVNWSRQSPEIQRARDAAFMRKIMQPSMIDRLFPREPTPPLTPLQRVLCRMVNRVDRLKRAAAILRGEDDDE